MAWGGGTPLHEELKMSFLHPGSMLHPAIICGMTTSQETARTCASPALQEFPAPLVLPWSKPVCECFDVLHKSSNSILN
jgi:hypothetical protein